MTITVESFLKSFNTQFEAPVRKHLRNVYGCLALSTLSATIGAYMYLFTDIVQFNFITTIGAVVLFFLVITTPPVRKNIKIRLGYLLGFAGLSGIAMGPVLEFANMVNPSIIVTTLLTTTLIFVSFTLSAMLAKTGQLLYLSGILATLLSHLFMLGFANIFIQSEWMFAIQLILGLIIMCVFVIYDTQLIIEKVRAGDTDFVGHSMDLFLDFIGIFRKILILLARKEDRKKRRD